jgi:hypothetical protein
LLTASDDNRLRLYDLPRDAPSAPALDDTAAQEAAGTSASLANQPAEPGPDNLTPALHTEPGETIYDYSWCVHATCFTHPPPPLPMHRRGPDEPMQASSSARGSPTSMSGFAATHLGLLLYRYPRMSTLEPASCCFASSSRGQPIQLWDACTGQLRCSYRGYNDADEPTAAYSLAFSPDGSRLLAGYNKSLYVRASR